MDEFANASMEKEQSWSPQCKYGTSQCIYLVVSDFQTEIAKLVSNNPHPSHTKISHVIDKIIDEICKSKYLRLRDSN